jgi:RNA recognition motif-containing protein
VKLIRPGVRSLDDPTLFGRSETQMSNNLFVGNLTYSVSNTDLETLFGQYGQVTSAQVITDRETGRSRGFGFVEMASAEDANAAIEALNGKDHDGRSLTVNIARERSR